MSIIAKKSLGQNWLRSESAIKKIVEAGAVGPTDTILEIGPGHGILTKSLLATGARVIAVEKDHRLINNLEETFDSAIKTKQLQLIEGDILKINNPLTKDYKVIANIPYYITGELLRLFLESDHQPNLMVLMVQKEVAERIIARDGKESILSISVKIYGLPKLIATIPAGAFTPKPKVDSAILKISQISNHHFQTINRNQFFSLVKKGFSQKRKQLINNLNCSSAILLKSGLPSDIRAEKLSVKNWLDLATNLLTL